MSRKFKVTAVAILATLTFATTAFAGLFDVVGTVVGGVLGVQTTTTTQSQLENFHKSYLEKSAARVLETGSVDVAFNEMVEEQRKIGCTVNVTEPDADHKIAEISGGDLPVTVKCLVNKKTQTITISYLRSDGMPTGNVLTKKYELPAGAVATSSAPAAPSDDGPSPFANAKPSDNPFANATPTANPFAGAGRNQEIERAFSAKVASSTSSMITGKRYIHVPTVTGCAAFDNSALKGNKKLIIYAFYGAGKNMSQYDAKDAVDCANREISKIADEKDPFAYDAMFSAFKSLLQYYKNGAKLDIYIYTVIDIQIPVNGTCFHVTTRNDDRRNLYNTRTQNFIVNPTEAETSFTSDVFLGRNVFDCDYKLKIPMVAAKKAYEKIAEITAKNDAVSSAKKPNGKITSLRICYAFDTPAGRINDYLAENKRRTNNYIVFNNATFKILAVENQYGKNDNTNWYPLVSTSGSNCAVIE